MQMCPLSVFLCPAGSPYIQVATFEVYKGEGVSSEAISVKIPRELRGRSEILVFLSNKPVRGTVT